MGKWRNGEMGRRYIAFHSANCSSNVMRKTMSIHALTERSSLPDDSWQSQCHSMHSLMNHLCLTVGTKWGYALHHSLQASSLRKFLPLAACYLSLNLRIVHTLFQLYKWSHFEASLCSCLHCYRYTV